MSLIIELLEEKRTDLGISKRSFATNYLGITEDTYSNWLSSFPSRIKKTAKEKIAELLDCPIEEIDRNL